MQRLLEASSTLLLAWLNAPVCLKSSVCCGLRCSCSCRRRGLSQATEVCARHSLAPPYAPYPQRLTGQRVPKWANWPSSGVAYHNPLVSRMLLRVLFQCSSQDTTTGSPSTRMMLEYVTRTCLNWDARDLDLKLRPSARPVDKVHDCLIGNALYPETPKVVNIEKNRNDQQSSTACLRLYELR